MRRALLLGLAATACDASGPPPPPLPRRRGGRRARAAQAAPTPQGLAPTFDGPDATRPQAPVRPIPVLEGLREPTTSGSPGRPDEVLVAEKQQHAGAVPRVHGPAGGRRPRPRRAHAPSRVAKAAFHPAFEDNVASTSTTPSSWTASVTRISEYTGVDQPGPPRVLLEVEQLKGNRNAGSWPSVRTAPVRRARHAAGATTRERRTRAPGWVDAADRRRWRKGRPTGSPPTIPSSTAPGAPETWPSARNRGTADFEGRLVVADAGQNTFEEVNVVSAGNNLGGRSARAVVLPRRGRGLRRPRRGRLPGLGLRLRP